MGAVRHSASKLEATMPTVQRVQTCPAADPNTCRSAPTQLTAGDGLLCKAKMYRVCSRRSQVRTCGVLTPPGSIAYVRTHSLARVLSDGIPTLWASGLWSSSGHREEITP